MTFISKAFQLVLISILATQAAWADETAIERVIQTKTIQCGYYNGAPYISRDPNTGKFSGFSYEIMEAIGKNLGLKIEWKTEIGIGEVAASLNSNKFDAMCATIWPNPARVQNMTPSMPLLYAPVHAYVRREDHRFDSDISKANNKDIKISAIDGDFSYDLAKEKFPLAQVISLPQMASVSDVMLQVTTKKADVVMMDRGTANDFSKRNSGALEVVAGVSPARIYSENIFVKRGEYHLRDMLNSAIAQLINDGVIDEIISRYNKEFDADYISPSKGFIESGS